MISTCHAAGVRVLAGNYIPLLLLDHPTHLILILDAVINHMAASESGTGVGGSSWTHYNYPGIYQTQVSPRTSTHEGRRITPPNQDFHHCGLTPGDEIVSYFDRAQVQRCELSNLAE